MSVRLADLAQARSVPVDVPVATDVPAPSLCDESVHRTEPGPRPEAFGPSLLARSAAREADLLERGIAAFEAGHEAEAYALFKQAVERNPRAERAWFWRAKTAQTLDEVIQCLERAMELDPANQKVRANLTWARQRREREKLLASAAEPGPTAAPVRPPTMVRTSRSRARRTLLASLLGVARAAGATAAIIVGAVWCVGGLPAELRQTLATASEGLLAPLPVIDASALQAYVPIEPVSGYNPLAASMPYILSALPYILGIFGLLVASGLLNREGWARFWGPLLALASAWLWLGVLGVSPAPIALALCGLVVLGGLASGSDDLVYAS
jgi:tetratricopeptide (TPR) repeat protein